MPTAIVSDVHANAIALDAVLAEIKSRGITRIVSLGDIIGYGPEPLRAVDLIRQHCAWSLMGNHDFGVLYEPTNFNPAAESAAYWTRDALDAEPDDALRAQRYEFLGKLKVRFVETGPDGRTPILFVHGSPRRPINEYIFPDDVVNSPDKMSIVFERVQRLAFCGHTHVPGVFTDEPDFYPPSELTDQIYQLNDHEKAIVNVGSVGQPRDLDPRASFVILHEPNTTTKTDGGQATIGPMGAVQFVRVPYDIQATASKMKAIPRLADNLADRLFDGR